jgi:hypothetical protein
MYALKFNEIKTDDGQIVRPVGYAPSYWPAGTQYDEAKTYIKDWFNSLNVKCFYAKLSGNIFEEYICFDTEADLNAYKTSVAQAAAIISANLNTAENDPETPTILTNAMKYMRLRNRVNYDAFGLYTFSYETSVYNLDTVDLTGYTRYDL